MSRRIRHCLECPKCRTRYLIGASPYRNGSYLISCFEERGVYRLYCSCGKPPVASQDRDVKAYAVSNSAHERGYGSSDEILEISDEDKMPPREAHTAPIPN
jgi:hypothetical protein